MTREDIAKLFEAVTDAAGDMIGADPYQEAGRYTRAMGAYERACRAMEAAIAALTAPAPCQHREQLRRLVLASSGPTDAGRMLDEWERAEVIAEQPCRPFSKTAAQPCAPALCSLCIAAGRVYRPLEHTPAKATDCENIEPGLSEHGGGWQRCRDREPDDLGTWCDWCRNGGLR